MHTIPVVLLRLRHHMVTVTIHVPSHKVVVDVLSHELVNKTRTFLQILTVQGA